MTGRDPSMGTVTVPVITSNRDSASWQALYDWLRWVVSSTPGIMVQEGAEVREVQQDEDGTLVVTMDGTTYRADIVIGADGYRSVTRPVVNPGHPEATYAGYMLWRGLCSEATMPATTQWARASAGVQVLHYKRYRLVAYPVPGPDGSVVEGKRQISWAWYDAGRADLLRQLGCLVGSTVQRTVDASILPESIFAELRNLAQNWPAPWPASILHTLDQRSIFGTSIAEYLPE